MNITPLKYLCLAVLLIVGTAPVSEAAPPPTPAQALSLGPVQPRVEYTEPTAAEAASCTVELEEKDKVTAWVVRTSDRQVLRKFIDTNADNLIDVWSYYQDGVEVYRDIDSNYNKKSDQFRWFNSGGTRWGIDNNEDGTIDRWRAISAHEVAEELVEAIRDRDEKAFQRLLLSGDELQQLGLGTTLSSQFREKLAGAVSGFRDQVRKQSVVTKESEFVDFGAARPGTLPAGADGATRDVTVYEGASALVDNNDKPEQVQVGAMVSVGGAWRLIEAPQVGSDGVEMSSVFALSRYSSGSRASETPPSEKMQELMSQLEKLDERRMTAKPAEQTKLIESRARLLRQLASVSQDTEMREQWISQLADMLNGAVVEGIYPAGVRALEELAKELARSKASKDLQAHVRFQYLLADWGLRSQDPKQDYAKLQDYWLTQLRAFVAAYPTSPDAAEAMLQLGMADEFAGKSEDAQKWYKKLAQEFSSASRGRKAVGALRRLNSIGKPITIQGSSIGGGSIDLKNYRGKYVLIQYWATWCESCKSDMAQIKQLYAKYGNKGFAVLGVNLDNTTAKAEAYLRDSRLPWKHAYDADGLDGRLANELGVMTLPLMILVDDKGRVVNRNIHVAELDSELKRLIR